MSEVKKSKAIQELRNNLLSVQDELVNSALDQIDKIGDSSLILPLIDAYFNRETDDLRKLEGMIYAKPRLTGKITGKP